MIGRFSHLGTYRELLQSRDFLRASFAGALALASFLWDGGKDGPSTIGFTLAALSVGINGLPIIWGAVRGVLERRVNVDELVSLAIVACLIQGELLSAAVVSFVMVLGALIEQATGDSARRAIQSLVNLSPQTATVLVGAETIEKPVSEIVPGEFLLIRPGDRIPVDAKIAKGVSAVDESSMTGEPIPKDKAPGEPVFAGTLNLNGVLEIEVTRVGEETTLGRVIRLVSEAEAHKPQAVRLIDRYARWFTPTILACAGLAWFLTGEVSRAVTVLIVGCPCALILAAPTAIVATIGRGAKAGILVKGGQYLEEVAGADTVLFDKTGTLTEGKPRVKQIIPVAGKSERDVLGLAACIERDSTHPLARAVLKAAHYAKVVVGQAEETCTLIGAGVRGLVQGRWVEVGSACMTAAGIPAALAAPVEEIKEQGATPLLVYEDCRAVGVISVADTIRPEAEKTVKELHSMGMKHVGLLSGDHQKSADLVAETVGLTDAWAEMKPEDKLGVIHQLQGEGRKVIYVGDGINDAPALATANVGIAMGAAGTDVALDTADVALMNDDVSNVAFLVKLSRRMIAIIKINLGFGLAFNALAVLASGGGYLSPVMGALVHNIGSVLVVLASASLAFYGSRPGRSVAS
jgi:Cd2+/Zn2+-exporting ATPase